jgi:hypothetical protein
MEASVEATTMKAATATIYCIIAGALRARQGGWVHRSGNLFDRRLVQRTLWMRRRVVSCAVRADNLEMPSAPCQGVDLSAARRRVHHPSLAAI